MRPGRGPQRVGHPGDAHRHRAPLVGQELRLGLEPDDRREGGGTGRQDGDELATTPGEPRQPPAGQPRAEGRGGGERERPTRAGKGSVPSPEGTQAGKTVRLKAKGIKGVRSGYAGDLFCHVAVETPVKLTDKQKDLLKEFERLTVEGGAKHSPQSKGWMDKVKDFFE